MDGDVNEICSLPTDIEENYSIRALQIDTLPTRKGRYQK
jgi:hypothetical protein